jgi:hypothetical protein
MGLRDEAGALYNRGRTNEENMDENQVSPTKSVFNCYQRPKQHSMAF